MNSITGFTYKTNPRVEQIDSELKNGIEFSCCEILPKKSGLVLHNPSATDQICGQPPTTQKSCRIHAHNSTIVVIGNVATVPPVPPTRSHHFSTSFALTARHGIVSTIRHPIPPNPITTDCGVYVKMYWYERQQHDHHYNRQNVEFVYLNQNT